MHMNNPDKTLPKKKINVEGKNHIIRAMNGTYGGIIRAAINTKTIVETLTSIELDRAEYLGPLLVNIENNIKTVNVKRNNIE